MQDRRSPLLTRSSYGKDLFLWSHSREDGALSGSWYSAEPICHSIPQNFFMLDWETQGSSGIS